MYQSESPTWSSYRPLVKVKKRHSKMETSIIMTTCSGSGLFSHAPYLTMMLKILIVFVAVTVGLYLYSRSKEPIFSHEIIAEITKEVLGKEKGMQISLRWFIMIFFLFQKLLSLK